MERSHHQAGAPAPVTGGPHKRYPDFVAIAKGFGCEAVKIESYEQLHRELIAANKRNVPTIVEIRANAAFLRR